LRELGKKQLKTDINIQSDHNIELIQIMKQEVGTNFLNEH